MFEKQFSMILNWKSGRSKVTIYSCIKDCKLFLCAMWNIQLAEFGLMQVSDLSACYPKFWLIVESLQTPCFCSLACRCQSRHGILKYWLHTLSLGWFVCTIAKRCILAQLLSSTILLFKLSECRSNYGVWLFPSNGHVLRMSPLYL